MSSSLDSLVGARPDLFESAWTSPANIAFVKYWGKIGHQIPANPSLSMTLSQCSTTTKVAYSSADSLIVELLYNGQRQENFAVKIRDYLLSLKDLFPWIIKLSVSVETSNTFPHGTGIASSASGLSAFALTFADYLRHLKGEEIDDLFYKRASELARLASGSACRSIYGGFSTWGLSELIDSSNHFATPFIAHPDLTQLCDTVLVIDSQEKNVSSRAGHNLMKDHYFAESRFIQAKDHFSLCSSALKSGDIEVVGKILESEALSLHAMMLTSPSAYTLLRPGTLAAIEALWSFRKESKLPIYFTLDAGPNLHLIYPESVKEKVNPFIMEQLLPLAEKVIDDRIGKGPLKCP
jgi:diphosphomevalonate decarboxylase